MLYFISLIIVLIVLTAIVDYMDKHDLGGPGFPWGLF